MIAKTYKGVDANGQPISYTKEQLLEGVDLDNLRLSIPKALETNEALRSIVMSSMVGEMLMDTSEFQQAILNGEVFAGEADLENFRKEAPDEQKREVEKVLGIDNIDTVDIATFNEKQQAFMDSPLYEQFFNLNKQMKARATTDAQQITGAPLQATANTGDPSALSTGTDTAQAPAQNIAKPLDNDPGIRYAKGISKRRFSFQHENFPQENAVQSEAHRLAVWWSYNEAREVGDQTLISMNGTWYLVEKFDDATCGYQVEHRLTKSEYERIYKEIKENGRSGNILSIQEEINTDSQLYQFGNSIEGRASGLDSVAFRHSRENTEILPVDSGKHEGRETGGNGRRDSESGGQSKQDLNYASDKTTHKALPNDEVRADTVKSSKSMTVLESIKFAQENVTEYAKLDSEGQARVCRLIRQAKANGFTDAETRAYARVAARSGIDIVIDKEGLYLGKDKNTGADVYADGLYSPKKNKILVNPEGTRSPARLLIHELTHAIYKGKGRLIVERGVKNLTDEEKQGIRDKYFKGKDFDFIEYADELNAHYTEALLDDDVLLEKLCDENPTLEDKIVAFLTGAKKAYADEPTLSREAKKLYKRYKTLFDNFSTRNQYGEVKGEGGERLATNKKNTYIWLSDSEGDPLTQAQSDFFMAQKL